ncbi:MAG: tRNA lysidine(34) synthetase TilS [Cyanobacteria bacterium J06634_5]
MAWSLTHAKLHTLLRKRLLLPKGGHLLMAVSGGQDSLCMAKLLVDLQPKWSWQISMVHCDHQWRKDSTDNANHVLALAKTWNVPIHIQRATERLGSEAAARQWRYSEFATVARAQKCDVVVTGHTQSDRAETVLYNLIRGTGIDGISALPWHRKIDQHQPPVDLVRPLLDLSRKQTGQFCQQHSLPIWEDSTNQDLSFRRNRIRQELLPYLQTHFNPQVEQALFQMAEITAVDVQYLIEQTHQLYLQVITAHSSSNSWEVNRAQLQMAPLALQRRVMKQLLQTALPHPPNFQGVEKLVSLLRAPNGSRTDTYTGGFVAQVRPPQVIPPGNPFSHKRPFKPKDVRAHDALHRSELVIWLGPVAL